jgi:hypothetical protein
LGILEELMKEYMLTQEDIDFALERAKGILLGYAMEHKAFRVLMSLDFKDVKFVDKPTHDFEALKDDEKYYIEVKATRKSPTKEYSAFKLAMIASLDGIHATLVMKPEPKLFVTEEILSEPKRILFRFFKELYKKDYDGLRALLSDEKAVEVLSQYRRVLQQYKISLDEVMNYQERLL